MKRARFMTSMFAGTLCLLTVHTAAADCSLSPGEITGSTAFANLENQMTQTRYEARDDPTEPVDYGSRHFAATAGHVIGQQVRHLGDDAERRETFDCLYDHLQIQVGEAAMQWDHQLAEALQIYQQAAMGIMDDEELREFGIDPDWTVPSIFDVDWSGKWSLKLVGPTMPGASKPLEADLTLSFRLDASGTWVVNVSNSKGVRGPFAARAAGEDITFEAEETGTRHTTRLTRTGDTTCTGAMTIVTRHGNRSDWTITGSR